MEAQVLMFGALVFAATTRGRLGLPLFSLDAIELRGR